MIAIGRDVGGLVRWVLCGIIVFGLHAAVATWLATHSDPFLAGSSESSILLDLDELPGGAAPGEGGKIIPKDMKKEVDPDLTDPDDKTEPEPPPPEPQPEPPPPLQKDAAVTLPPPPKPQPKPINKRAPVVGAASTPRTGAQSAGAGGDIRQAYGKKIVAHLNSHKRYPATARARNETGVVTFVFTINRQGQLLASRIVKGSGYVELDREVLDMLKRAQPFPQAPAELADKQFQYTAPMRYHLN